VARLPYLELIFGRPWLKTVNPIIDWQNNIVSIKDSQPTKRDKGFEPFKPDKRRVDTVVLMTKTLDTACILDPPEQGDAGTDLRSNKRHSVKPGQRTLVGIDIAMAIPHGTYGRIWCTAPVVNKFLIHFQMVSTPKFVYFFAKKN
jgi:dUTPase